MTYDNSISRSDAAPLSKENVMKGGRFSGKGMAGTTRHPAAPKSPAPTSLAKISKRKTP